VRTLARRYGLNRATLRKWKQRDSVEDRSHRPHELHATLTPAQPILTIQETLELPLDDLLVVPRVQRCGAQSLGASAMGCLRSANCVRSGRLKGFKPYEPAYLQVDVQ
jgi:transposase-like protein